MDINARLMISDKGDEIKAGLQPTDEATERQRIAMEGFKTLKQGSRVRHPKYGEGTVFRREGDGDDAKITVQFQQHGVKKLVEKFAQLEAL